MTKFSELKINHYYKVRWYGENSTEIFITKITGKDLANYSAQDIIVLEGDTNLQNWSFSLNDTIDILEDLTDNKMNHPEYFL